MVVRLKVLIAVALASALMVACTTPTSPARSDCGGGSSSGAGTTTC
jgi:hypothetical protein